MITPTQLKPGMIIEYKNAPHQILNTKFSRSAQSGGFVTVKMKNLLTTNIIEDTFREKENFEEADLEKKEFQYLYQEGTNFVFMDKVSFDQIKISRDQLGEKAGYLKEGLDVELVFFQGKLINLELPIKIELKVIETEPGFRGDTATSTKKAAKLETGISVSVPLFVNQGDLIRIDTRTGEYIERA